MMYRNSIWYKNRKERGALLRERRQSRGYSIKETAQYCELSYEAYRYYERQGGNAKQDVVHRLMDLLGIDEQEVYIYFPAHTSVGTKWCSRCAKVKKLEVFPKDRNPDGRGGHCLECRKLEKLLSTYNLTEKEHISLQSQHKGRCAICNQLKSPLCVDHDHSTGHVRGLLCHSCNRALGLLKENTTVLKNMIEYVERYT